MTFMMLGCALEFFPRIRYQNLGLQIVFTASNCDGTTLDTISQQ